MNSAAGRRLQALDVDDLLPPHLGPDEMVVRFQTWAAALTYELFLWKTMRVRTNKDPWITDGIRKLSKQKRRVFRRKKKSRLGRALDARMQILLEESKSAYVDRMSQSGTSTRGYFNAVKKLGSASSAAEWSLPYLFPDCTAEQAGEEAAKYFTRITDLFIPLAQIPDDGTVPRRRPISEGEVAKRLKAAKKPSSSVEGDLLPRVVKAHHALLVPAVTRIFNAVFSTGRWPSTWKVETTAVIPKVTMPESLGDCRNISCTPFLSKVLEGGVLDDLRERIPVDETQYGGIKGCSVDHLLVDLFEELLEPLESGSSSLVLSVDYEKAFNHLDHQECLTQLQRLGADPATVALTRSFLTGRSIRVQIAKTLSGGYSLSSGSPQCSILGCYLYCAAT